MGIATDLVHGAARAGRRRYRALALAAAGPAPTPTTTGMAGSTPRRCDQVLRIGEQVTAAP